MNSASGRVKLLKGWLMEEGEETNQLTKEEGKVRTVLSATGKNVRDVLKKKKENEDLSVEKNHAL
jgi:hypothetical protein